MGEIHLLDQSTINKIAAGEVIDRPVSVIKELMENAIDAGSSAITVEIREGGVSLIRVTDNGKGIDAGDLQVAFKRHSTSKIKDADDLLNVESLGFRGEALSSIAAVARVELITRTHTSMVGSRYVIEGGKEMTLEEAGAPEGTTIIVRDLFFNVPARKKFLKTAQTEGGYIYDMVCKLAMSHPEVSFRYIQNGQSRLHTSGNHNLKDVIYNVYGKNIAAEMIPISYKSAFFEISGFIGKPIIGRRSRANEIYFINGRYIKSNIIQKAIEEGYRNFLMQHTFPFTVFNIHIDSGFTDVNVHPSKMELRFRNQEYLYEEVQTAVRKALTGGELSPNMVIDEPKKKEEPKNTAVKQENFLENQVKSEKEEKKTEEKALYEYKPHESKKYSPVPVRHEDAYAEAKGKAKSHQSPAPDASDSSYNDKKEYDTGVKKESDACAEKKENSEVSDALFLPFKTESKEISDVVPKDVIDEVTKEAADIVKEEGTSFEVTAQTPRAKERAPEPFETKRFSQMIEEEEAAYQAMKVSDLHQQNLFDDKLLKRETISDIRLCGQIFDTYWICQYKDTFMIIDQHAAHEKVNYEKILKQLKERVYTTQRMSPPKIISLSPLEQSRYGEIKNVLADMGFEIEPFGGNDFAVYGMPDNLVGIEPEAFLEELLAEDGDQARFTPDAVFEKAASMACKASIKGNQKISDKEAEQLIADLVDLENPYTCPHGRPTMIKMTKYELEKKFKRVL